MRKFFTSIFLLFFLTISLFAIEVPKSQRIPNRSPGYCAWTSLESLGLYHGIEELKNLTEKRSQEPDRWVYRERWGWIYEKRNEGCDEAIVEKLSALKVKHCVSYTGEYNWKMLNYTDNHGCVVGMKASAFGEPHAIILTKFNNKKVEFIDPNEVDKVYVADIEWFNFYWDGFCVIVWK